MEREDFCDPAIAALMNEHFVNVKVDREEHPELDELYMTATALMTGRGGWPNSVFLTTELAPFFAGSYFPPEDRGGLPGFPKVLRAVSEAWRSRREEVLESAASVANGMKTVLAGHPASSPPPPPAAVEAAVAAHKSSFDGKLGGLGSAPKFPSAPGLGLLWDAGQRGDAEARAMVLESLKAMGRGAIHDQLGGGFHRYTLDAAWRIPHFEKMLYDNALLGELLARAAGETGDEELTRLARDTMELVLAEMTLPEGGFAAALDAETAGQEGAFYTWSRRELEEALDAEGLAALGEVLGLDEAPNLDGGRRTLYLTAGLGDHAARLGVSRAELDRRLAPHLDRLRAARSRRPRPALDDKVLVEPNGLMIAAMALAGRLLGEPRFIAAAGRAAQFILEEVTADGALCHTWRQGRASLPALLEDYACLIHGLLALHEATGEAGWLERALPLAEQLHDRLAAPGGGYFTSQPSKHLLFQARTGTDNATPSGNAMTALDFLRLAKLTGTASFRQRAMETLGAFASDLVKRPHAMPTMARALARFWYERAEPAPGELP
jgi:uncharacterized protein